MFLYGHACGVAEPDMSSYRQSVMSTQHRTINETDRPKSRTQIVSFVAVSIALGLAVGAWWTGSRGFMPPVWKGSWGCSDVGYPSPPPSFNELVDRYGESPYCARRVRGEAWF